MNEEDIDNEVDQTGDPDHNERHRAIPLDYDDTLFFLWVNGLSYAQIADKYINNPELSFDAKQLARFSRKRGWRERKAKLESELKEDFTDIIKLSQSKKMAAMSMVVNTVSDMIVSDIQEYKKSPEEFWRSVHEFKRPRPFWMAKNVDDIISLFRLQNVLVQDGAVSSGTNSVSSEERSALLAALAKIGDSTVTSQPISMPQLVEATDAEFVELNVDLDRELELMSTTSNKDEIDV